MNERKTIKLKLTSVFRKLAIMVALVGLLFVAMNGYIRAGQQELIRSGEREEQISATIHTHEQWMNNLVLSVYFQEPFTGKLDAHKCAVGQTVQQLIDHMNPEIAALAAAIAGPHQAVHEQGVALLFDGMELPRDAVEEPLAELLSLHSHGVIEQLEMIREIEMQGYQRELERMNLLYLLGAIASGLIIAASTAAVIAAAKHLDTCLVKPIHKIATAAAMLGKENGNLGLCEQPLAETNMLAKAIRGLQEDMNAQAQAMISAAGGDLTGSLVLRGPQDKTRLAYNRMIASINRKLSYINDASQQIFIESHQVKQELHRLSAESMELRKLMRNMMKALPDTTQKTDMHLSTTQQSARINLAMNDAVAQAAAQIDRMLSENVNADNAQNTASVSAAEIVPVAQEAATQSRELAYAIAAELMKDGVIRREHETLVDQIKRVAAINTDLMNRIQYMSFTSTNKPDTGIASAESTVEIYNEVAAQFSECNKLLNNEIEKCRGLEDTFRNINGQLNAAAILFAKSEMTVHKSTSLSEQMCNQSIRLAKLTAGFKLRADQKGINKEKSGRKGEIISIAFNRNNIQNG